jgi:hypothetical protein
MPLKGADLLKISKNHEAGSEIGYICIGLDFGDYFFIF